MHKMCFKVLSLVLELVLISITGSVPPIQSSVDYTSAEYIPDGVMVHGGTGLHGLTANWIVLIQFRCSDNSFEIYGQKSRSYELLSTIGDKI